MIRRPAGGTTAWCVPLAGPQSQHTQMIMIVRWKLCADFEFRVPPESPPFRSTWPPVVERTLLAAAQAFAVTSGWRPSYADTPLDAYLGSSHAARALLDIPSSRHEWPLRVAVEHHNFVLALFLLRVSAATVEVNRLLLSPLCYSSPLLSSSHLLPVMQPIC